MKIYLVDYIGMHCGMHYYNDAFCRVLSAIPGLDISVLSNYADKNTNKPFCTNTKGVNSVKYVVCCGTI